MSTKTSQQSRGGLRRHKKLQAAPVGGTTRKADRSVGTVASARVGSVEIPIECACGCGSEINALTRRVHELSNAGTSSAEIALALDRSRYSIETLIRTIPRFRVGHTNGHGTYRSYNDLKCRCRECSDAARSLWAARRASIDEGPCPYKSATGYRYGCRCDDCRAAHRDRCRPYETTEESRRRQKRRRSTPEAKQRKLDYQRIYRDEPNREHVIKTELRNASWRQDALVEAQRCAVLNEELARLMQEQSADRAGERAPSWMVYLDEPAFEEAGTSRYDRFDGNGPPHLTEWNDPTLDAVLEGLARSSSGE